MLLTFRQWVRQRFQPQPRVQRRPSRHSFQPRLEHLERREVPATITVKNVLDEAAGTGSVTKGIATSLRAAIEYANSHAGADTINLVKGKVYQVTEGELVIDTAAGEQLTIQGVGGTATIERSGDVQSRLFRIGSNPKDADIAIFNRLKIQGGSTIGEFSFLDETSTPFSGSGGGILNHGTLSLNNSVVTDNFTQSSKFQGGQGGGIYNDGTLTLTNSVVSDNTARGDGFAFEYFSKFAFSSDGQGGGIYNASGGQATINSSTISGNKAVGIDGGTADIFGTFPASDGFGGGLYNAGQMAVTNSTFSSNAALGGNDGLGGDGGSAAGGGIFSPGTGSITNATIASNSANAGTGTTPGTGDGGGIAGNSGSVSVWNTIVGLNKAGVGLDWALLADNNVDGMWGSLGHNLIGFNDDLGAAHGFSPDSDDIVDATDAEIGLDPLGNYGGPTPTHRLKATSLAINAGDNSVYATLKTDQRGSPRKVGLQVDIGAFESPLGGSARGRRWG
jgi:hypothetical protein